MVSSFYAWLIFNFSATVPSVAFDNIFFVTPIWLSLGFIVQGFHWFVFQLSKYWEVSASLTILTLYRLRFNYDTTHIARLETSNSEPSCSHRASLAL